MDSKSYTLTISAGADSHDWQMTFYAESHDQAIERARAILETDDLTPQVVLASVWYGDTYVVEFEILATRPKIIVR